MTEATGRKRYYNCQWAQEDVETLHSLLNNNSGTLPKKQKNFPRDGRSPDRNRGSEPPEHESVQRTNRQPYTAHSVCE